jgi:DNA modification methylase
MIIEKKKISDLIPAPYNPRQSTAKQEKHLKESLEKFGLVEPIIFNKQTGWIVGGHFRVRELIKMGVKEVECVIVDLNEDDEMELNIRLNANTGSWDWDTLANDWEVVDLEAWGLDIPQFETVEELEASEDDYEVPEGGIETDIVIGDLFEIGEHRLLCGDSTDSDAVARLMNGEKADMVFTSPPYNGNTSVGFHQSSKKNSLPTSPLYNNNESDNKTSEEYIQFNADIFNTIKTIAADDLVILYNINYNRNSPSEFIDVVNVGRDTFSLVETIIWEKSMAISLAGDNLTRIVEFIFVLYNGDDKPKMNKTHTNECIKNLWKISNSGANHEIHKACFPIKLVEQGINIYAKQNALLYEPFTGSGSTMVAAHQLKRRCYGMELEPKYCAVIIDRMRKLDSSLIIKRNGVELKTTK